MLRLVKVDKKAIGVHCWTRRDYEWGDRDARRSRSWALPAGIEIDLPNNQREKSVQRGW
jgi:hypothetical protein